jgi:hypothetical protein
MESDMNRFQLQPNPNPEFKRFQPLPVFRVIPTAKAQAAEPPEVLLPGAMSANEPGLPAAAMAWRASFTTFGRNAPL